MKTNTEEGAAMAVGIETAARQHHVKGLEEKAFVRSEDGSASSAVGLKQTVTSRAFTACPCS